MDPYTNPDQQSHTTLAAMITRLEERAKHSVFEEMIRDYIAEIPKNEPLVVLDFGCGTGVVIRALEPILHPDSELHGADISTQLLEAARTLSGGTRIHWDKVEAHGLPYSSETFDVIIMHTLLSHVPNPEATLKEAARLLKPAGRLIVFDADHAGTTFGLKEFSRMRECDFRLTSAIASQPDICRQMPRYLKAAGFALRSHRSRVLSECGKGDFWLSSVRGFARLIPALGILPEVEGGEWVKQMLEAHETGTFFAAGTFYTFHAERASPALAQRDLGLARFEVEHHGGQTLSPLFRPTHLSSEGAH
jgi:SAM-dependent methyltransferase